MEPRRVQRSRGSVHKRQRRFRPLLIPVSILSRVPVHPRSFPHPITRRPTEQRRDIRRSTVSVARIRLLEPHLKIQIQIQLPGRPAVVSRLAHSCPPGGMAPIPHRRITIRTAIRRIHARHQTGTPGHTYRTAAIGIGKHHSLLGDLVQIRRLHQPVPRISRIPKAMLIRTDKYNIRP